MSEDSITQDQIDALLGEVSIEDRLQSLHSKIKNKISRSLHQSASRDLLVIKKELGDHMKALEGNETFSLDFINSFKTNYKAFTRKALSVTQDYALFELLVKLESLICIMFYQVDEERRRYPRFPLTLDLILTIDNQTCKLFGADISSLGISFYAPCQLVIGRRYEVSTPSAGIEPMAVDVLRTGMIEPEQLGIFRTACAFPNLLPWEQVRDIIKISLEAIG